jgi:hypothetical protein
LQLLSGYPDCKLYQPRVGRIYLNGRKHVMIPANLTTNEVKNAAGTEEEFLRQYTAERKLIFAKSGELPNLPHRLTISHVESGAGVDLVRRSLIRIDKTILGVSGVPRTISTYEVTVIPVGDLAAYTEVKNAKANLMSFTASQGATTTILYDCTGYGADAATNGTL